MFFHPPPRLIVIDFSFSERSPSYEDAVSRIFLRYRKIADCATRHFTNSVPVVLSLAVEVLYSLRKLKEEYVEREKTVNIKVNYRIFR